MADTTEAGKKILDDCMKDGILGRSLSDISWTASQHGLRLSRQTLHNWYTGKYTPSENLLELFTWIINGKLARPCRPPEELELNTLQKLISDLWNSSHGL